VAALSVATATFSLVVSTGAEAARFAGGNLVVYRVGAGAALTNAAAPVFLDEFSPTGAKVQSIALPTAASAGNRPLTAAGLSRSEGLVARSADGRFVTLTGYAAAPGTAGPGGIALTASAPAAVARVVGIVDANGTVDTSTGLTGTGTPSIIRSAVTSDGDRIWATGGNGGVSTTTLASATLATTAGNAGSNLNALSIVGGQLFTSGSTVGHEGNDPAKPAVLSNRLAAVGAGAPTSGAALGDLPGLPANLLTYGYSLLDLTPASYGPTGLDTVYLANASDREGTVEKYRFNGSAWALAGRVDVPGATGLVAAPDGAGVSIAITTPSQLLALRDPAGADATFAPAAPAVLASAAANTEFRGVALAPTDVAGPSLFVRTPTTGSVVDVAKGAQLSALATSAAGVTSVTATLAGKTVTASKGAGNIWTAALPGGLPKGAATLSVTAKDATGSRTVTRKVTIGSSLPAGTLGAGSYSWKKSKEIKQKGTWKAYKSKSSPTKKGYTSAKKNSTAKVKVLGSSFAITFDTSAKAGLVKVAVDGKSKTIDLYSAKAAKLVKKWKFKGVAKVHKVVVTVLGAKGKKAPAKAGTGVFLGKLQVKA
jgi:hypothetical protein